MKYTRVRDGATVSKVEACDAAGRARPGYSAALTEDGETIGFDAAFFDSAPGDSRITFRDAAVTLTDAESTLAVSKAQRAHYQRHAYLGDRAPAFTDAQATAAVSAAVATKQARTMTDSAIGILHAETAALRYVHDQAKAARKQAITNGWRK